MRKPDLLAIYCAICADLKFETQGSLQTQERDCRHVHTATWCHSVQQMSTAAWHAFWLYQPILPLLSCDIPRDTTLQTHLWNAAAQGLQLSDSVAVRLPRAVTPWPCSLLVSLDPQLCAEFQKHSEKAWEEGNLLLILLRSAMETATKPELKGKSETLSPSPCT